MHAAVQALVDARIARQRDTTERDLQQEIACCGDTRALGALEPCHRVARSGGFDHAVQGDATQLQHRARMAGFPRWQQPAPRVVEVSGADGGNREPKPGIVVAIGRGGAQHIQRFGLCGLAHS